MNLYIIVAFLFISVISIVIGIFYGLTSLTVDLTTGEHLAMLACACMLFAIALGVWIQPILNLLSNRDE